MNSVSDIIGSVHPDILCSEPPESTPDANGTSPTKVDVLFLLDVTSSMTNSIEGVKTSIENFVAEFRNRKMDAHVGLIAFRDRTAGEEPQLLLFNTDQLFTGDTTCFSNAVGKLRAAGGGTDLPESQLDALALAAHQHFRINASRKVLIMITDSPPKVHDKEIQSIDEAVLQLRAAKLNFLYFIVNDADKDVYSQIKQKTGWAGGIFPLNDAVTGKLTFDQILPEIARNIADS